MRRKKNPPIKRRYGLKSHYTKSDLDEALAQIKTCKLSQRQASERYNIPRSTLKYKLKGEHKKPVGKPTALADHEEKTFVCHIIALSDLGIPIGLRDVRLIVKKYLDDQSRTVKEFKNNMPGWEWGKNFLDRHSELKQRIAHNISRKRAQVNKEMIEKFFDHLKTELADVRPENLYNFDETGFHDCPRKKKLLFRRQCRNPEMIKNATKSCFTTMFCGNAAGEFLPPFIIYKAKQKWSHWLDEAPPNTRMTVTKSGWIDVDSFDEWFESQVLPEFKKKEGTKVIIGDNLSSHISIKTLKLCNENNIKFICLLPNSTHLLQPLDVAYFSSLKTNWRSVLDEWRNTRRGKVAGALPKDIFASLLKKTLEKGKNTAGPNIIAGFKATGLYPCNVEVPLRKLPGYAKPIEEVTENIGESFKKFIDEVRKSDLDKIVQKKRFQLPVVAGKSVSVEEVQRFKELRAKTTVKKKQTDGSNKNNEESEWQDTLQKPEDGDTQHSSNDGLEVENYQVVDGVLVLESTPEISNIEQKQLVSAPKSKKRGRPKGSLNKKTKKKKTEESQPPFTTKTKQDSQTSDMKKPEMVSNTTESPDEERTVDNAEYISPNILMEHRALEMIQNNNENRVKISPERIPRDQKYPEKVSKTTESPDYEPKNKRNIENVSPNISMDHESSETIQRNEDHDCDKYDTEERESAIQIVNNALKAINKYIILNYEGTMFPGRIVKANHPKYQVSLMSKASTGWIWPSKVEIIQLNNNNIIKVLRDDQIIRKMGYFLIEDDFLEMEWGDGSETIQRNEDHDCDKYDTEGRESAIQIVNNALKAVNKYIILNYEGTMFPGRIVKANHPKYQVSLMSKASTGWIWPSKLEIIQLNNNNIIRVLRDDQIIRKKGYFLIEDDFLEMEWGD